METKKCPLIREYLRQYTAMYTPLACYLPADFSEYFNQTISGESRTEYRKAVETGYGFSQVTEAPGQALIGIMASWKTKSGRDLALEYNDLNFSPVKLKDSWPGYYNWDCPTHRLNLYVASYQGRVVGYLELLLCGEVALVHSVMAHQDHQSHGLMRFMFIEVAKRHLGKKFLYGVSEDLKKDRRHFLKDMGFTNLFVYTEKESRPIVALDVDDLAVGSPGIEEFIKLREHYPKLKVTFFMIPVPTSLLQKDVTTTQYREFAAWLKDNADWVELCPHGLSHAGFEMREYRTNRNTLKELTYAMANELITASEHTFEELGLPYQKIWKSPHWETSIGAYQALWDRGYTVAIDPNQHFPRGGKVYAYNWSIDRPCPKELQVIKGHGHMYPPSANAIQYSLPTVMTMPEDADFRFISEVIL